MKHHTSNKKIIFSLLTLAVITFLVGLTFFSWRKVAKRDIGLYIVEDIARLAAIFERIDATAGILGFDYQKNPINFLNIKKDGFVGSELGSMNLKYPDKWEGPYEYEMPRIQEEDYIIVRTKKGYFITPADGVRLPNGKIIGKDIILDEDADIEHMMHDDQLLSYQGMSLAAKIKIGMQPATFQQSLGLPKEGA